VKNREKFVEIAELRKVAGLGVNIRGVNTSGCYYLKGFFNAVESWRSNRDIDGWRLADSMFEVGTLEGSDATHQEYKKGYPISTRITSELIAHTKALLNLFSSDVPLMVPLRPTDCHK